MDSGEPVAGVGGQSRNIVQLLALFLLLLSFFILLNSLSRVEARRARAVLGSLSDTFAGATLPNAGGSFVAVSERDALQRFQSRIREALRSIAPALAAGGGDAVIQTTFAANELFQADGTSLRADRDALLRGIAEALQQRPADLRFEVELVLAARPGKDAADRARAGGFARALIAAGAPKEAIAIGIGTGRHGTARLRFAARAPNDGQLRFEPAAAPGGSAP